jgi:hypothetical protein
MKPASAIILHLEPVAPAFNNAELGIFVYLVNCFLAEEARILSDRHQSGLS